MISLKNTLKLMAKMVSPVGTVQAFAGSTVPSGWLLCNGQAVSRTTYSKLYSVIGTIYGTGDGSTTFNLPNLQGRVPVGVSSSDNNFDLADTGGEKEHTLSVAEMPSHGDHLAQNNTEVWIGSTYYYLKKSSMGTYGVSGRGWWDWNGSEMYPAGYPKGGGAPHNNLQPYIALNYIICVG